LTIPHYPDKHGHPAAFSAADVARHNPRLAIPDMPANVIITFQQHTLQYLTRQYKGRQAERFFGEFHTLRGARVPTGVVGNFGIGAPAAVFVLEWLAALGARRFIIVGFAGGMQETLNAGDLILCDRALRDEGTSHHYLPPQVFARPDAALTTRLAEALTAAGLTPLTGPSWTTDAPFRETLPEIDHYSRMGMFTVEMEAAAVFAAGEFLGIPCAAAFSVGDSLKDGRWQVDFDRAAMHRGLEQLADAAMQAFEAG